METTATFSKDRKYRYALKRIWIRAKPLVCFVGLNPSTADENTDDNTIRREIGYAARWGYGGLIKVNLFGFMATKPKDMFLAADPVGPENDDSIINASAQCEITVLAWGNNGSYLDRDRAVIPMIENPHYLKLTGTGQPGHPLYLKKTLGPLRWGE